MGTAGGLEGFLETQMDSQLVPLTQVPKGLQDHRKASVLLREGQGLAGVEVAPGELHRSHRSDGSRAPGHLGEVCGRDQDVGAQRGAEDDVHPDVLGASAFVQRARAQDHEGGLPQATAYPKPQAIWNGCSKPACHR